MRRDTGFTLVELLTVVIIVGILAAVAVPVFLNQRRKAVDASGKADLRDMALAFESWNAADPSAAMDPTTTVTDVGVALKANGFKSSPGNEFYFARMPGSGYCFGISSSTGSTPLHLNSWMWYDTAGGGLVAGGRFLTWAELRAPGGPGCRGTIDIYGDPSP